MDGRIKYRNGKYVNIIHKYDERYDMIKSLIRKKIEIVKTIAKWTEDELLNAEANYYHTLSQCGIGYHGDGERRKVFTVRIGASERMPLYYQWYQRSQPVGERIEVVLQEGDMYVMSEKAVGFDWLKKIVPTLRHASGVDKFTVIKPKK